MAQLQFYFQQFQKNVQKGPWPYVVTLVHILLGAALVYASPRSTFAFLVLVTSFFSLYYLKADNRFKLLAGVILAVVIVPILGVRNIFYLEIIFQISVFAALALGLNIIVGFAGLLVLGYVAFYAVGAYLWGFFGSQQFYAMAFAPGSQPAGLPFLLPGDTFYLFLMLAIIAAALTGILIGLPVMRLRGDYLAIVTLGFGEVIRVLANNLDKPINLTNGPQGITPIQRPSLPPFVVDGFNGIFGGIVGHPVDQASLYNVMFYILALAVIITIVVVTRNLEDSKIGRAWAAIREDETAAVHPDCQDEADGLRDWRFLRRGHGRAGGRQPHLCQPRIVLVYAIHRRFGHGYPWRARQYPRCDFGRSHRHHSQPANPARLLALPEPVTAERCRHPGHQFCLAESFLST